MLEKFSLGKVVATCGVMEILSEAEILVLLKRHADGDWGVMPKEDKEMNDKAVLTNNERIFSAYKTSKGDVWIITEWDRSVTTILLPGEY